MDVEHAVGNLIEQVQDLGLGQEGLVPPMDKVGEIATRCVLGHDAQPILVKK